MSGGFFRGTSADQDTRFSNKQAKLMKSQKFAPELEHLVDMSKVKMDVLKPWIANRVTEFLGFEDEVLINFIYGLLDVKEVNGKEVQISLTGFMEKNTGKFMRELWVLLLSAQNNATGVPQQFLDAKEEETRKKKAEADQIANEIQKRKDKEAKEYEQEKLRKMEDGAYKSKVMNADVEPNSRITRRRASSDDPEDELREVKNGFRGQTRVSRSPHSSGQSPVSPRDSPKSIRKSRSNSRSYSDDKNRARSASKSPLPQGRSTSAEKVRRSPRRRSITPRQRRSPSGSISPSRRNPSRYMRKRSRSPSYRRSVSPVRRRFRSPLRRRSPSPFRRRSPSPVRRRSPSPVRRRSPSPVRRRPMSSGRRRPLSPARRRVRSPVRGRSPSSESLSPVRRRSPSPARPRSPYPVRRRSPSPVRRRYRRSPSTPRRGSPPLMRHRSPIAGRRRSPLPSRHRSPSPNNRRSPSPDRRRSPLPAQRKFPEDRRRSPVHSLRERSHDPVKKHEETNSVALPLSSMRSPQRDANYRSDLRKRAPSWSPSPEKSPMRSESPPATRKSTYKSPVSQARGHIVTESRGSPQKSEVHKSIPESFETSGKKKGTNYSREDSDHKPNSSQKRPTLSSTVAKEKDSSLIAQHKEDSFSERSACRLATKSQSNIIDLKKKSQEVKSENISASIIHPEASDKLKSPTTNKQSILAERVPVSTNTRDRGRHDKSKSKDSKLNSHTGNIDSGSEDSDKDIADAKEKRHHTRSDRHEKDSDEDNSSDSQIEDKKEVKRRRKEEKRMRKEERRRRHDEKRRRKKEERRAEKKKEKNDASDGENVEEAEFDQKQLEIELRKKALESLRAKKGTSH